MVRNGGESNFISAEYIISFVNPIKLFLRKQQK